MKMQFKRTLITPLGEDGKIQTNPILVPLAITDNSVEAKESSETIDVLGSCCGQKVVFGAKEVTGSLSGVLDTTTAFVVAQHLMGKFNTEADATAEAWASATVVAVGNIVNHSDGTHSLSCVKAGTTDATEPTITVNFKSVTDGSVKWMVLPKLKKGVTNTSKKPRAMAIENEFVNDDGTSTYIRYLGVYINKTNVTAKGSDTKMEWSTDVMGAGVEDSFDDGYTPLKDMTNAKTIQIANDMFAQDESKSGYISYKDGAVMCDYEEMGFDVSREVKKSESLACYANGEFTANAPVVSQDVKADGGKMVVYATPELYQEFKNHETFNTDIQLINGFGGSIKWSFKGVLPSYAGISIENCMDSKLSPELFVTGDCNGATAPVSVEVIYPQLVDTNGDAVVYPI